MLKKSKVVKQAEEALFSEEEESEAEEEDSHVVFVSEQAEPKVEVVEAKGEAEAEWELL